MNIKGFHINYTGDASVGIFPANWEIIGDFFFEDESEIKEFKEKLLEAWEYCSDTPIGIETFEEREKKLKDIPKLEQDFPLSKTIKKDDFENMLTELKARTLIFHQDEHSKGFNEGLEWAKRMIERYKKGEGIFQL